MPIKNFLLAIGLIISSQLLLANDFYIAKSAIKVKTGAGTEYAVAFTLPKGSEVEVLEKNDRWYKILYLDQIGYVHAQELKFSQNTRLNDGNESDTDYSGYTPFVVLGFIAFLWLLPILVIISSDKTGSREKIAWVLAVLFISWFAWIFYMLLAPLKQKE
jgi:Bacterial SH3 domain